MTSSVLRSPTSLGIFFALAAFGLFSTMDMLIKRMTTGGFHVAEVAFYNGLFSLLPILAMLAIRGKGVAALRTKRLGLHVLRGVIGITGGLCAFYGYTVMPMADAYSIAFSAPLFITALSVPVLKEAVGWRRWTAVAVGFVGVVIMLRPGAGALNLGAAAMVVCALAYAVGVLIIRRISRDETDAAMMLYPSITALAVTGAFLPFVGQGPSLAELSVFALSGTLGGLGQICLIQAFRRAPAAVVAPFQYTQLLWGVLYGALVFGNFPDQWTYVGAPIVVGSGLYILYRETRRKAEVALSAPLRQAV